MAKKTIAQRATGVDVNKHTMAEQVKANEQGQLIDTGPENAKEIIIAGRAYNKAKRARQAALADGVKYKQRIRDLVHAANLQRLDDGSIHLNLQGMEIIVTPVDEKVTVKSDDDD
jgi:hypothetical protein